MITGEMTMFKKNDWFFGLVSIAIGAFVLVNIRPLWNVKASMDPAGPAALPAIIAWGMIGIGLVHVTASAVLIQKGKNEAKAEVPDRKGKKDLKPVMLITIASVLFIGALPFFGYPIAMPLLIAAVMGAIGVRDLKKIAMTSILTALILFVSFVYGLRVDLPLGIFERFF